MGVHGVYGYGEVREGGALSICHEPIILIDVHRPNRLILGIYPL